MTGYKRMLPGLLAVAALWFAGCGIHDALRNRIEQARLDVDTLESQGAKICAPKEFAQAEAYLDFCVEEWEERDFNEARRHLTMVRKNIEQAQVFIEGCHSSAETPANESAPATDTPSESGD